MDQEQSEVKTPAPEETASESTQDSEVQDVKEEIEQEIDHIEELTKEIERLTQQLNQSKTDLLRAYADTDNTRKRLQREADLAKQYRFQSAATALLPVVDNLDMALSAVPENEEAANFAKGFEMISKQLKSVLEAEGVTEIEALDKPFDANFMQALMMEPKEGVESGIVIDVLQKGYKLKDRLLRPALVKVSE